MYEDIFPAGIIGHVTARDADQDMLTYTLASQKHLKYFSIDQQTGAISAFKLDEGVYMLNVSATDGRFTGYGIIEVGIPVHEVFLEVIICTCASAS